MKLSSITFSVAFFAYYVSAKLTTVSCTRGVSDSTCLIEGFEDSECIKHSGTLTDCATPEPDCEACKDYPTKCRGCILELYQGYSEKVKSVYILSEWCESRNGAFAPNDGKKVLPSCNK